MVTAADSYWRVSRAPRYSILFALPLLVAYEALAAFVQLGPTPVRNGADVILKSLFQGIAGPRGPLLFGVLMVGTGLALVVRDLKKNRAPLRARVFLGMLGEAIAWSLATGLIVGLATSQVLRHTGGLGAAIVAGRQNGVGGLDEVGRLTVSLGAGLYEELLFRVLLVTGLSALATRVAGAKPVPAGVFAVVTSALIFSAFHYIGPYGDPFGVASFTFRALAGLWFSGLYLLRGFGLAAWTHALYDVWILA
jgi:hypothetical protein